MSGHSKWATTHRQKSLADAKRGAIFTKFGNLITVAAREGGADLESNFKLRLAVEKARTANMPKDNIERAINKGAGIGKEGEVFEQTTYEIIGPAGSGFIVEAITDNKNRTAGDLKSILNKNGCQLGGPNSVAWNFRRVGLITIDSANLNDDSELLIIDAGAEDLERDEQNWEVVTAPENLMSVAEKLKNAGFIVKEANLAYLPNEELTIANAEDQERIDRIYNLLEDLDDVSNVYTNAIW